MDRFQDEKLAAAYLMLALITAAVAPYDTAPPAVRRFQDRIRETLQAPGCAVLRRECGTAQCHDPRCVRCFGTDALPYPEP